MTDQRSGPPRPIHLAVLVGASAGIYAVGLAAVTMWQSGSDEALTNARAPVDAAIRGLSAANDRFSDDLDVAGRADGTLSAAYDRLGSMLDRAEATLDGLSTTVSGITGAANAMPNRVALPAVPRQTVTRSVSNAHATTGASGG
jgi:hypothetical protein